MGWIFNLEIWISLVTLTVLELVLGIDNIVFISILAGKLPESQRERARRTGLALALITRIMLLCALAWMAQLTQPWWSPWGHPISGRDLILGLGGIFLIYKATHEIHSRVEGNEVEATHAAPPRFSTVIAQILVLDLVFSLDSVITAVGMASRLGVMIGAVVLSVIFMLYFSRHIGEFIDRHPTLKVLALSFLLMIGVTLVMEGAGKEVHKGYIYFAMAFSAGVESLNIRARSKSAGLKNPSTPRAGEERAGPPR